ncbi:SDR family oxidoreductase [Thalassotalea montiporae]
MSSTAEKVALIVGAGDYIGSAIAKRFAQEGYLVSLGRRKVEKLQPLVDEISELGGKAKAFALDARDEANVEQVFADIENTVGEIDVMIFNVGANVQFPILETTSRVFHKVWEMACFAGFLNGREAAKYMVPRKRGSIFFTGATASVKGNAGFGAFSSAKAGLRSLAQAMARELGPQNIHVAHLVIDAGVDTEWVHQLMKERGIDESSLPEDGLMKPESVAQAYWQLHQQSRDAWTFELDIRPYAEKW